MMKMSKEYRRGVADCLLGNVEDVLVELGCTEWSDSNSSIIVHDCCEVDPRRLVSSLARLLEDVAELQRRMAESV